jgi:L-fuculose-phosphate aldolase
MKYSEQQARTLVVQAGHRLLECGLVARTWGNISARVSDTHFVITPSGRSYESLTPEDLVLVQIADCAYEGDRKPSSEKGIHAAVYRHRKDAGFVIHTHQDYASCVGVGGQALTGLNHPLLGNKIPCGAYGMPSTKKLQKGVEAAMLANPEAKAIFMRQHGALCMAEDFEGAFALANALEEVCKAEFDRVVKIPAGREVEEEKLLTELRKTFPTHHFRLETDAAVQAVAAWGKPLRPHLDDLAQIAGAKILCAEKAPAALMKAIKGNNAVLIPGVGALLLAEDAEDMDAIAAILRKSARTALYAFACNAKPLSAIDRRIMRLVYTMKYAKKKAE